MALRGGLVAAAVLGIFPFGGRAVWLGVVSALLVLLVALFLLELAARDRTSR